MHVSKRNIIFVFMLVLPVLDAINGIMSRQYGKSIGTIYHTLLTIVLIWGAMSGKRKVRAIYIMPLFILFSSVLLGVLTAVISGKSENIAVDLLIKMCCTVLNLAMLYIMVDRGILERNFCDKVLQYTSFAIPISMVVSRMTGISNSAYISSEKGFLGFYSSSNELNCIILILVYFCLAKYYATRKSRYLIAFFMQVTCAVMIESKLSMGMCLIAVAVLSLHSIKKLKCKVTKAGFITFTAVIVFFLFSPMLLNNVFSSFMERQSLLKNIYAEDSFFNYFSSGRTDRFVEIIGYSFGSSVDRGGIAEIILKMFRLVFGNGFCNWRLNTYFEMEYFDTFFWCGLTGEILLIWMTVRIIMVSYYTQGREILPILSTIVAFVCAFFSGHVICGGVAGIYLALTCVNTSRYNLQELGEMGWISIL